MRDEIVVTAPFRFIQCNVDAVVLGYAVDLRLRSRQPEDPSIKGLQIIGHDVTRVALRIHRDEQWLKLTRIRAEFLQGDADICKRRRAQVGTGRVAKEDQQPFSVEALIGDAQTPTTARAPAATTARTRISSLGVRFITTLALKSRLTRYFPADGNG